MRRFNAWPINAGLSRFGHRRDGSRRQTLELKLAIVIILCVAAALILTTATLIDQAHDLARKQAGARANEIAFAITEEVSRRLGNEFRQVLVAADGLAALRHDGVTDTKASDSIIHRLLSANGNQRGAWLIWSGTAVAMPDVADKHPSDVLMRRWERTGSDLSPAAVSRVNGDEPIYREPIFRGQAFVSEPFYLLDADGGHTNVISYAEPIVADGAVLGSVGIDVAVEPLQTAIALISRPSGSELSLASNDGTVVATTRADLAEMSLQEAKTGLAGPFAIAHRTGRFTGHYAAGDRSYERLIQPITLSSVKTPWFVVVDTPLSVFPTSITAKNAPMLIPTAVELLCLLGIILVAIRAIVTKPLRSIELYIRTLRDDVPSASAFDPRRSDEIGSIAQALVAFKKTETEIDSLKSNQVAQEARHAAGRRREFESLADQLARSVQAIASVIDRTSNAIMHRAEGVVAAANQTAVKAKVIVDASTVAGLSVAAVDSATTHLRRSIDQITFEANDARTVASNAAKQARDSTRVTSELSAKAMQIGAVVETISKIAERTNLLALNATIEAARSGEAGRAFSIVAQEVKALAAQTAIATDEIAGQIEAMRTSAANAAVVLASIGSTVQRIDDISSTISGAVSYQSDATSSIAGFVGDAVAATRNVDLAIGQVDQCADDAGRTASSMLLDISALTDVSRQLNEQVSDAILRIRSA